MQNLFQKATKEAAKLRMAISGPSGSGKTFTSLVLARELGGKTAYIDTEHGSASKYADLFDFDVINMDAPYSPTRFVEFMKMAEDAGYDVLIIDSLSHAWNGKGGLLEIVDEEMARKKTNNSFVGWKKATPMHNDMIEAIISSKIHIIATMRSKQEYVIEKDSKGKTQINKVGMAPIQRDGMEYEFDVWGEMDVENRMLISKTRCPQLAGKVLPKPGKNLSAPLIEWLKGVEPKQKRELPQQTESAPTAPEPAVSTPPYSDQERTQFHAIGGELYGSQWDEKRRNLVKHASNERTDSMKELTAEEFQRIFAGLKKRQQEAKKPQTKGEVSEALYSRQAA